jgi:uncharacterized protein (DUF1800 family)
MKLLLRLAVILFSGVSIAAPPAPMGVEDARHLLNRAGFGARPADLAEFSSLTRAAAVERLLAATPTEVRTPVPVELTEYIPPLRIRELSDEERRELQRKSGIALRRWWVDTLFAAQTPAEQLRERMTLFWHNHFVSSVQKVKSPKLMLDQNRLLRRHALGRFDELLHAIGKDPAMVVYLDSATSRRGSPNENFAREVMELFTLGEGNYREQDVKEAARAFTGWSIEPATGEFRWRPFIHDDGEKTVLGVRGRLDGDAVLDILLAQPQTAEHLTRKLWREFVSPTPDEREVRRIASRLRGSGYDLRLALGELLRSPGLLGRREPPGTGQVAGRLRGRQLQQPRHGAAGYRPRWPASCASWGRTCSRRPTSRAGPAAKPGSTAAPCWRASRWPSACCAGKGAMDLRQVLLDPAWQLK